MKSLKDCFTIRTYDWDDGHHLQIDSVETLELIREALKSAACEAMSTEYFDDAAKLMFMVKMIDEHCDELEEQKKEAAANE